MSWIFLTMLAMVVLSVIVEWALPQRVKNRLGTFICACMVGGTMFFLAVCVVLLLGVTWINVVQPFIFPEAGLAG